MLQFVSLCRILLPPPQKKNNKLNSLEDCTLLLNDSSMSHTYLLFRYSSLSSLLCFSFSLSLNLYSLLHSVHEMHHLPKGWSVPNWLAIENFIILILNLWIDVQLWNDQIQQNSFCLWCQQNNVVHS